jgi:hypothetical protein
MLLGSEDNWEETSLWMSGSFCELWHISSLWDCCEPEDITMTEAAVMARELEFVLRVQSDLPLEFLFRVSGPSRE